MEKALNNHNRSTNKTANVTERSYDKAYVYPYPAIPRSTRPALERSFQIENIDRVDPSDAREIARRSRLEEVNHLLDLTRAYCGDELCAAGYKAAALGVVEDLQDGLGLQQYASSRAAQALGDFFRHNSNDCYSRENVYIAGLLQDRRRLDKFRQLTRSGIEMLDYQSPPTVEEWLDNPVITDADTLYEAVRTINVESILVSGAETLLQLTRHPDNTRLTLDVVRYSEQLIAPIAEVIGFDTLAMSLNDATKTIRLTNGGRPDLLIKANAVIDRYRSYDRSQGLAHNTSDIFKSIVGRLFGPDNIDVEPQIPVDYGDCNSSVYGDAKPGRIVVPDGEVDASWRFRLKTAGSLAWKMYQAEKRGRDSSLVSMDILGITAVVRNEDDQVRLFRSMVNGLYSHSDLEPHAAPSKISPVHVRGMADYIKHMTESLPDVVGQIADIRYDSTPDALHLGKVTGFYRDLPFEIQCVTRPYRNAMQTGQLAHIIYKNNTHGAIGRSDLKRWEELLVDIRGRRERLGDPGLVGSDGVVDGKPVIGDNELAAREFIRDMLSMDKTVERTAGYIATENT